MEALMQLRKMLEKEVDKMTQKGDVNPNELDSIKKVVEIICKIDELEGDPGYSGRYRSYDSPRSYGRYYDDRFRGDWPYSYDRSGRQGGGYSGHDSKESMVQTLRMMMDSASSDRERSALADCLDRVR